MAALELLPPPESVLDEVEKPQKKLQHLVCVRCREDALLAGTQPVSLCGRKVQKACTPHNPLAPALETCVVCVDLNPGHKHGGKI